MKGRILLVQIEQGYINLALEKVSKYWKQKGYTVVWNYKKLTQRVERIYISCLFTWNRKKVEEWKNSNTYMEVGGSGIDLKKELPRKIEKIKPRVNVGYTSRGCIRRCAWCPVYRKEGSFRIVGDLLDLWDGRSPDVALLDNNILVDKKHFNRVCRDAMKHKIRLKFYQGLDHRLLDSSTITTLNNVSHRRLRFSFDQVKEKDTVRRAIDLLDAQGVRFSQWFVLVGYNTSYDDDLERIHYLRDRKQTVYLARYNNRTDLWYIPLARWVNCPKRFNAMSMPEFLNLPENKKYKKNRRDWQQD